jgi:DNA mismatch repair protein MutS2
MVLAGRHCVPNDVELPAHGVLVISGPNAGGKTVALKSVGLAVLMARAGLHVAAGHDSRVPWVSALGTDIGDSQSLDKDLSTFSAHLDQLRSFFARVDRGGLLLLDEVAAGTDPEQGAALARAVLEGFADRGVTVLSTTHYESLKALAAGDPRFVNASVGFDLDKMEPTFVLRQGVPGTSGALHVARRMGLPAPVVARAEELLGEPRARVEGILAGLEEERRKLEEERTAMERARAQAEAARRQADHETEQMRRLERKLREAAHGEALEALRKARLEVDEVRQFVKRRNRDEDLALAKLKLDEQAEKVAQLAPEADLPGQPASREQLVAGCKVWVKSLGKVGEVAEVPERGKIPVMVGALKSNVDVAELRLVSSREAAALGVRPSDSKGKAKQPHKGGPAVKTVIAPDAQRAPVRTGDTTCDVRGERVDDAVAQVDRFIDDSMRMARDCIFVVHGHGSGALRSAVREHLRRHPVVSRYRSGEPEEGGDGVTVAWLDVS